MIDTHYGAIAAKAVLMKPKDLVVQEKAQEEFEKMLPGWPGFSQVNKSEGAADCV